jgi:aspartyl-tRNA(Asn)/glutamyl-tRNA(Gln) amidotransferase subunit B
MGAFGLSDYDASVLTAELESAAYFDAVAQGRDGKLAANWVINELFGRLKKEGTEIGESPVSAAQLGGIVDLITAGDHLAARSPRICSKSSGSRAAIRLKSSNRVA